MFQEGAGKEVNHLKVEINLLLGQTDAIKQNSFDGILSMLREILVNVSTSQINRFLKYW